MRIIFEREEQALRERLIKEFGVDHVISLDPIRTTDYDRTPLEHAVSCAIEEADSDMELLFKDYSSEEMSVIAEVATGRLADIYEADYQDKLTVGQFAESKMGAWHAYALLCDIAAKGDLQQYGISVKYTDIVDWYYWATNYFGDADDVNLPEGGKVQ